MESEEFRKFSNEIEEFRKNKFEKIKETLPNEEETKLKLINPFLRILGYDVEEHGVLVSEDVADYNGKKGKKIDYVAYKEGSPIMLIEAKKHKKELSRSTEQLDFYFNHKNREGCHLGLLTNGVEYRFFSDLDRDNKLDEKPFFIFDLRDFEEKDIKRLQKFTYECIDVGKIKEMGEELKRYNKILETLKEEMQEPSDELTSVFIRKISQGRATNKAIKEFRPYLKKAFKQLTQPTTEKQESEKQQMGIKQNTTEPSITKSTNTPSKTKPIYSEDKHLKEASSEVIKIYTAIKRQILALKDVEMVPTKLLIKFVKNKKDIAQFVIKNKKIRVSINIKYSEAKDYKNKLKDVSNIGRWGSGQCEFNYENIEDMEYLFSLIKQSYDEK